MVGDAFAVFDGPGDDSTRYSADDSDGTPGADGWVVRFDDIDPGADGTFTLTMSFDGTGTIQGKYSNAITITETDPTPP